MSLDSLTFINNNCIIPELVAFTAHTRMKETGEGCRIANASSPLGFSSVCAQQTYKDAISGNQVPICGRATVCTDAVVLEQDGPRCSVSLEAVTLFPVNVIEVSLAVSPEAVTPFQRNGIEVHNSAREFVSFTVVTLVSSASQKRPAYACGL